MPELLFLSFEPVLASLLTCLLVRELLIVVLPDSMAGPDGSFIDTGPE